MMDRIIRVIVYSKSVGSSLEEIFKRKSKIYPKSVPFYGWIKREKYEKDGKIVYTLMYSKSGHGGDYYLKSDFEIADGGELFSDKDFEL